MAAAKSELITGMDKNGVFFKNSDQPTSNLINLTQFKGKIINIGFTNKAHYTASDIIQKKDGTYFNVTLGNNHTYTFFIPSYGKHNVSNALFAIALSNELGYSVEQIQFGLKTYEKPYGRLDVNYLRNDIIIIDDTFNTKPSSMKAAIDTLSEMPHKNNNKIAVLGCMNDLGKYSTLLHKEIGKYFAAANIDYLYTIGREAQLIKLEAIKVGFPSNKTLHFQSKMSLLEYFLKSNLIRTTILFNGYSKVYSKVNKTVSMRDIVDTIKRYYKN
ncbi:glutamate ligase domain-containing protein [Bacillus cereus]|uniref:glutamate ligase domain-containing protein n=1 Tax=Bacillus cereus TaxID=1396 RepID=UPI00211DF321|nr:Mur ligase family protein [Bacillus cereus]